jgi:hypothetical protein
VLKKSCLEGHGLSTASQKYMRTQWIKVVEDCAKRFKLANPRFKEELFYAACGHRKLI